MRKPTPTELKAAHRDERQRPLPLDQHRPREKPGPLTKARWMYDYFDRHNWLTANGGNNVCAFAGAIAYRRTLHHVMDQYRCTEARAIDFLEWCGLKDRRMSREMAREKLNYIEWTIRRRAGQ